MMVDNIIGNLRLMMFLKFVVEREGKNTFAYDV